MLLTPKLLLLLLLAMHLLSMPMQVPITIQSLPLLFRAADANVDEYAAAGADAGSTDGDDSTETDGLNRSPLWHRDTPCHKL